MCVAKPWHVVVFALCLGVSVYLASALWSAIFITALPQSPDAILDGYYDDEAGTEWIPTEFSSTLEELKHYHNLQMRERNKYWVLSTLVFGAAAAVFVFVVIPHWRGTIASQYGSSDGAVGSFPFGLAWTIAPLGFLVALIVPLLLSWILPAPERWFPAEIREIAETRQNEALLRLEREAAMIESTPDS